MVGAMTFRQWLWIKITLIPLPAVFYLSCVYSFHTKNSVLTTISLAMTVVTALISGIVFFDGQGSHIRPSLRKNKYDYGLDYWRSILDGTPQRAVTEHHSDISCFICACSQHRFRLDKDWYVSTSIDYDSIIKHTFEHTSLLSQEQQNTRLAQLEKTRIVEIE
jgi:hypothetical protein